MSATRVQHKGAVRYWRFLQNRRRLEILLSVTWMAGAYAAYRIISLSPTKFAIGLTAVAATVMTVLSKLLLIRRRRK